MISSGAFARQDFQELKSSMNICAIRPQSSWGNKIWRRGIQPRRSITIWKVLHNKIATEVALKKHGFSIASCCRLCMVA